MLKDDAADVLVFALVYLPKQYCVLQPPRCAERQVDITHCKEPSHEGLITTEKMATSLAFCCYVPSTYLPWPRFQRHLSSARLNVSGSTSRMAKRITAQSAGIGCRSVNKLPNSASPFMLTLRTCFWSTPLHWRLFRPIKLLPACWQIQALLSA